MPTLIKDILITNTADYSTPLSLEKCIILTNTNDEYETSIMLYLYAFNSSTLLLIIILFTVVILIILLFHKYFLRMEKITTRIVIDIIFRFYGSLLNNGKLY
jgi:hypothetical protein